MIYDAAMNYWLGSFDGKTFKPETGPLKVEVGRNFYAAQTWENTGDRRVQIGWMRHGSFKGMPFNQQMSFPCELTLRTTPKGVKLFRYPVKEIKNLYTKTFELKDHTLKPKDNPLKDISGELFDIEMTIDASNSTEFGLHIGGAGIIFRKGKIWGLGPTFPFALDKGKRTLRILLDRTSAEVFIDGGERSITSHVNRGYMERGLSLYTRDGEVKIHSLKVTNLKSIYAK